MLLPHNQSNNDLDNYKIKYYNRNNLKDIPQIKKIFSNKEIFDMEVVSQVLPFKVNNYVINELINWDNPLEDSIFRLTFPNKDMLLPKHFEIIADKMLHNAPRDEIEYEANKIRMKLNPHPAGQLDFNVPIHNNERLTGLQHKYDQTVLFFPSQGQTCHSYCTFCFRWPQFVKMKDLKFKTRDLDVVLDYIRENSKISDILITGGDPMTMSGNLISGYIRKIVDAKIPHLRNIRIGTKSLAYFPHTYLSKDKGDKIIDAFKYAIDNGMHLSIMAHYNHFKELETEAAELAIERIIDTGANIRTQSPIMRHINDSSEVWQKMLNKQVNLGMIPYYMFIARDTGAQHYFKVSLSDSWKIFKKAYSKLTGLARTVRGPSMSCEPGKVQVLGINEVNSEKVFSLRFLQGRNSEWVHKPFFAKYDENAFWLSDLKPAFGNEKFFFEDELKDIFKKKEAENLLLDVN